MNGMPRIRHLTPRDYKIMPWKNHRGTTAQMAIFPETAQFPTDSFLWRISTASIASSGPFSSFPGYDRTLVILDGSGASLNHDVKSSPVVLERLTPYLFRGDWETTCELSDEAIRDFGLMTRRGQVSAEIKALKLASETLTLEASAPTTLLYCSKGTVRAGAETLQADELLWIESARGEKTKLQLSVESGSAELLQISIKPLQTEKT